MCGQAARRCQYKQQGGSRGPRLGAGQRVEGLHSGAVMNGSNLPSRGHEIGCELNLRESYGLLFFHRVFTDSLTDRHESKKVLVCGPPGQEVESSNTATKKNTLGPASNFFARLSQNVRLALFL